MTGGSPAPTPTERGVVADFFRDSAHRYISIPSASAVPRAVFETVGGFPEGMKIGEDLYMWIKIARRYKVCFSPKPLANYSKVASNRSSAHLHTRADALLVRGALRPCGC